MSKTLYKLLKRFFDILLSSFLLLFLTPLFLIVAILIYFSDKGSIFVKEPLRLGLNGREFRMFKFRTMIPNGHMELLTNPSYKILKQKWMRNGNKLRIDEDIRITRIGKILRRTDIDELPQLLNVFLGQMSLVGPRPSYNNEVIEHLKEYPEDSKYLDAIWEILPGITGIWQVSGRNEISLHKRLIMEAEYSKDLNFLTDLIILLKTPFVVFNRKGAYE